MKADSDTVQIAISDAMREHVATAIYLRLGHMETSTSMRRNDAIDAKQYDIIKKLDHEQERMIVDLEDVAITLRGKGPAQIPRAMLGEVRLAIEVRLGYIETGSLLRAADAIAQNEARSGSRFGRGDMVTVRPLSAEQISLVRDLEETAKTLLHAQFPSMAPARPAPSPEKQSGATESKPRGFKSMPRR
jgi:hypothetical protein